MARTRAEAIDLLEAMRSGRAVDKAKDPTETLKQSVERGSKVEQLSYTELTKINSVLNRMRAVGEVANLTTIQNALTARVGAAGGVDYLGRGRNVVGSEILQETQGRGIHPAEGSPAKRALNEAGNLLGTLPDMIKSS